MESLFILIPIAIVIVAIAVFVFFWAVKNGQFEDLDTEAKRILFDNEQQGSQAHSADKSKPSKQPVEQKEQEQ
ncbi:cbb3-type cytochrome oxidase assembly protein CcoS [Agaribacterium sp. ZY112]|uniref:cbb3-type cytochrome oxidase assembly protein CcoS n=1 Tax=Agaribacterium sp. ZY112 TaxID=3233574 RepID=UPI0035240536